MVDCWIRKWPKALSKEDFVTTKVPLWPSISLNRFKLLKSLRLTKHQSRKQFEGIVVVVLLQWEKGCFLILLPRTIDIRTARNTSEFLPNLLLSFSPALIFFEGLFKWTKRGSETEIWTEKVGSEKFFKWRFRAKICRNAFFRCGNFFSTCAKKSCHDDYQHFPFSVLTFAEFGQSFVERCSRFFKLATSIRVSESLKNVSLS